MNIVHVDNSRKCSKKGKLPVVATLDCPGAYFTASSTKSRYYGWFQYHGSMWKIIDEIVFREKFSELVYFQSGFTLKNVSQEVTFRLPKKTVLQLSSKKKITFELDLDIRESYDTRKWGKYYQLEKIGKCILITHTKLKDKQDNEAVCNPEYKKYLAIRADTDDFNEINRWVEKRYDVDLQRNSEPYSLYVYKALSLTCSKAVFSYADTKTSAIRNANAEFNPSPKIELGKLSSMLTTDYAIDRDELTMAYTSCVNSLRSLRYNDSEIPGIFAGLPWFFQFWTRDEAISLGGFLAEHDIHTSYAILDKHIHNILEDGRIANRTPHADLGSADGVGWVFKRLYDFLAVCEESYNSTPGILQSSYKQFISFSGNSNLNPMIKKYIKNKDILEFLKTGEFKHSFTKRLEQAITRIREHHIFGPFIYNEPLETWMDTVWKDDSRPGMRVEIQAQMLLMYRLAYDLTKKQEYRDMELQLRKNVRDRFFNGELLADGLGDFTVRPNIFIAAYIYPLLLTKEEWKTVFEHSLTKLWLPWGGLTTIDKSHPLFTDQYTGESNQSYHRGDSWYWLNNLAAILLHRSDKISFKPFIEKIIKASIDDILYSGAVGHHSEVSSAKEQTSDGCFSQAWSAAMFIELVHEINNKKT